MLQAIGIKQLGTTMDVIIIGGGPCGAAAAITAANAGMQAAVITKKATLMAPGTEPLESVHPGISTLLKAINAEGALADAARATYTGIYTAGSFMPLSTNPAETWEGSHISPQAFSESLMACAAKAGVTIIDNGKVAGVAQHGGLNSITLSTGVVLQCRHLVDASGRARFLGRKLNFREYYYSPPLTTWSGVAENVSPGFFETMGTSLIPNPAGWSWLAPEPPTRCTWTRLAATKQGRLEPPGELAAFKHSGKIRSANVRWRLFNPVVREGLLLAGDAGGIIDPGAGQGILNALYSGIMAGKTVVNIVQGVSTERHCLSDYNNWFINSYEQRAARLRERYEELGILFLSPINYHQ